MLGGIVCGSRPRQRSRTVPIHDFYPLCRRYIHSHTHTLRDASHRRCTYRPLSIVFLSFIFCVSAVLSLVVGVGALSADAAAATAAIVLATRLRWGEVPIIRPTCCLVFWCDAGVLSLSLHKNRCADEARNMSTTHAHAADPAGPTDEARHRRDCAFKMPSGTHTHAHTDKKKRSSQVFAGD